MSTPWNAADQGILRLPSSGRLVRGRGLIRPRRPLPQGPDPEFALYALGQEPPKQTWPYRWLPWRDFWLPTDHVEARAAIIELWDRSATQRVEVACGGGRGRTGTVLACLAVLDGVPSDEAVAYVRRHYDRHAAETPWQRRYVRRFAPLGR